MSACGFCFHLECECNWNFERCLQNGKLIVQKITFHIDFKITTLIVNIPKLHHIFHLHFLDLYCRNTCLASTATAVFLFLLESHFY